MCLFTFCLDLVLVIVLHHSVNPLLIALWSFCAGACAAVLLDSACQWAKENIKKPEVRA